MNACGKEKRKQELVAQGKLSHHAAGLTPVAGKSGGSRIRQKEPQSTM